MDKSGIQLSITLPPGEQYQPSPMVNIQGDDPEQFKAYLTAAAGVPDLEPFFRSLEASALKVATGAVERTFPNDGGAPATTAVPGASETLGSQESAAPTAPSVLGVGSPCPNLPHAAGPYGAGKLKSKNKRDGSGSFIGCDAYPVCDYIKRS